MLQFFHQPQKKIEYWDKRFYEEMCFCICESLGPYILKMAVTWIATFPEWLESGSCDPVRSSKVFRPAPRLSARSKVLPLSNIHKNDPEFPPMQLLAANSFEWNHKKLNLQISYLNIFIFVVAEKNLEHLNFLKTDQSQQFWGTDKQIPLVLVKFFEGRTVCNISIKISKTFLKKV